MTHLENAALYSARSPFPTGPLTIDRSADSSPRLVNDASRLRGNLLPLLLVGALALLGCKKETENSSAKPVAGQNKQPARAVVPLRVWLVGSSDSRALVQRQWQATSERPLDLRMLTSDELLEADKCQSDVIVFPAHLIGDLLARQWLVELPSSLTPASLSAATSSSSSTAGDDARDTPSRRSSSNSPDAQGQRTDDQASPVPPSASDDGATALQPIGWIDQARYGGRLWGLSLGIETPVVMSNFDLPQAAANTDPSAQDPRAFWQAAIESLAARSRESNDPQPPLADAEPDAVCDRFLVILTSIGRREARFGALLNPETLQSQLAGQEFIDAAEVMLQLHKLNAAPQAMAGSYQAAWQALAGEAPCLSIGVPPLPTPEVDKVTSVAITLPPPSPALSGARGAMSERTLGWNSGHGSIVALTSECRQTSLAVEFMRWLAGESTRNVLARSLDGVSAPVVYAPGSSAWQVQRLEQRISQQTRLPNEPRLPGSARYRRALGEQLIRMLNGELEPKAALEAAAAKWDEITAMRETAELRASYEASLGL